MAATPQDFGRLWLVILAIGLSAVSLYYYLKVLKQAYVIESVAPQNPGSPAIVTQVLVVLLALAVVFFGCVPDWFVGRLTNAIALAGW